MNTRCTGSLIAALIGVLVIGGATAAAQIPTAVSPGAVDRLAEIEGRCPTFSWGAVAGALRYELEVYRLGERDEEAELVLQTSFAGSISSWTPTLDHCLERGGSYAWWLRALHEEGPGEWSDPAWFAVSARVTETEFREALAVVRSYLEMTGEHMEENAHRPGVSREPSGREIAPPIANGWKPKALGSPAATAIRAEVPGAGGVTFGAFGVSNSATDGSAGVVGQSTADSGVTHGLYGQVQSPTGVAGAFDNIAGGKILSGLNNASEVFSVAGTGAVTATSFAGDGSSLSAVVAADLACADCVDGSEIVDDAIGSTEIAHGSVASDEVVDESLTASDLAPNSVNTSEIAPEAVGASEMLGSFCLVRRGTTSCPAGYTSYSIMWDTEDTANADICTVPPAAVCGGSSITMYFCCK